jgi:hypothetical protein
MDRRMADNNNKIYITVIQFEGVKLFNYLEGDCFGMKLTFAKSHSIPISKSSS